MQFSRHPFYHKREKMERAIKSIEAELEEQIEYFKKNGSWWKPKELSNEPDTILK